MLFFGMLLGREFEVLHFYVIFIRHSYISYIFIFTYFIIFSLVVQRALAKHFVPMWQELLPPAEQVEKHEPSHTPTAGHADIGHTR
jgi:hypothetical protein